MRIYYLEAESLFLMKDIVRDGDPVLRKRAAKVSFPLSDEDQELAKKMMEYLEVSQDPELCEKYKLRAGVGLAAPQVGVSKQMAAVLVPATEEGGQTRIQGCYHQPGNCQRVSAVWRADRRRRLPLRRQGCPRLCSTP